MDINIDTEDLEQVNEFFEIITHRAHEIEIPINRPCNRYVKLLLKGIRTGVQLVGMTMSLVSANVITSYFNINEFGLLHQNTTEVFAKRVTTPQSETSQKKKKSCDVLFGCHDNVCWRMCYSDNPALHLWCHTSPNPFSRKIQHCDAHTDCLQCWECVETCHP